MNSRCAECPVAQLLQSVEPERNIVAERAVNLLSEVMIANMGNGLNLHPRQALIVSARLGLALGQSTEGQLLKDLHPELEEAVYECETKRSKIGNCALSASQATLR